MNVHENGAKRHGFDWLTSNQVAVETLWGTQLSPSDPGVKEALPLVILRILDRLRVQQGLTWDSVKGWIPVPGKKRT